MEENTSRVASVSRLSLNQSNALPTDSAAVFFFIFFFLICIEELSVTGIGWSYTVINENTVGIHHATDNLTRHVFTRLRKTLQMFTTLKRTSQVFTTLLRRTLQVFTTLRGTPQVFTTLRTLRVFTDHATENTAGVHHAKDEQIQT